MKITKYELVTAVNFPGEPTLEEKVGQAIKKGWQPLGAPYVIPETDKNFTITGQAMVKYRNGNKTGKM